MSTVEHAQVIEALGSRGMLRSERLFADGQGLPVEPFRLLIVALETSKQSQRVETFGDCGMLRSEHLLADRQGLLVEGLGLRIEAMEMQERSGLVEQPRRLREVELGLCTEHRALLDVGHVILQVKLLLFTRAIVGLWKGSVDGPHGPLCPCALGLLIHTLLEHYLHETVDAQHVCTPIASHQ